MEPKLHRVGKDAGKVWQTLATQGTLSDEQLLSTTKLSQEQLHSAIGWLARENKIVQEDESFRLGETNLTTDIGKHAGMIWKILDIWEEADITSIIHLARIEKKDAYAALGWLAREEKIDTIMQKQKTTYSLKEEQ